MKFGAGVNFVTGVGDHLRFKVLPLSCITESISVPYLQWNVESVKYHQDPSLSEPLLSE